MDAVKKYKSMTRVALVLACVSVILSGWIVWAHGGTLSALLKCIDCSTREQGPVQDSPAAKS